MDAMKGKSLSSIIIGGDLAMRNVIRRVFPKAQHMLCGWHLMRNTGSHEHDKAVLKYLKGLMIGDFEVGDFEHKWWEWWV